MKATSILSIFAAAAALLLSATSCPSSVRWIIFDASIVRKPPSRRSFGFNVNVKF